MSIAGQGIVFIFPNHVNIFLHWRRRLFCIACTIRLENALKIAVNIIVLPLLSLYARLFRLPWDGPLVATAPARNADGCREPSKGRNGIRGRLSREARKSE